MSEAASKDPGHCGQTAHLQQSAKQEPVKKQPKKLKVRHLSELSKRIIVERFAALLDYNEVAVSMEMPGLTGTTVSAVIAAHHLNSRKPPAGRTMAFGAGAGTGGLA